MKEELMKEEQEASVRPAVSEAPKKERKLHLPKSGKGRRRLRMLLILAVVVAVAVGWLSRMGGNGMAVGSSYIPVQVMRQDLTVSVSGSATLEPADAYNVTTLISGTIQSAPFEEGDLVSQDTLLYTLDSSGAQDSVARAGISVEQAQLTYQQALDALNPTATISGVLNEVYVHDGDSVNAGDPLCKIVTSTDLTIDFLFTYVSPEQFYVGQSATVFIGDFDGSVQGTVTSVSNGTTVTSNGRQTCSVRVKVENPGIVSTAYTARAVIGSYSSYGAASITMPASATVYAAASGSVSGFSKLSGSTVTKGEVLCTVDSDPIRDNIQTARLNLESARLSASTAADSLDDYTIEAPISGTVIEKTFKAGDKVDGASSGTLAVIYDLSSLKMEMNVDELNIGKVQVGQAVEVTSAAFPGQTFTGTVEKVSVNGTTTNGFTNYPVTITLQEYGDLRPGMNVSARILGETVEGAVCVPVEAVSRGDTVQVALPGALAEDGATVADPSKIEERPVSLGINDETYIQITSGLEEGETVLIADQTGAVMGG